MLISHNNKSFLSDHILTSTVQNVCPESCLEATMHNKIKMRSMNDQKNKMIKMVKLGHLNIRNVRAMKVHLKLKFPFIAILGMMFLPHRQFAAIHINKGLFTFNC